MWVTHQRAHFNNLFWCLCVCVCIDCVCACALVMALSISISIKLIANHLFHMNNLTANLKEQLRTREVLENSGEMVLTIFLAKKGMRLYCPSLY